MHLPVAIAADDKKLSKRSHADSVKHQEPVVVIAQALVFLGQNPPQGYSLPALWDWALEHWDGELIPRRRTILPTQLLATKIKKTQV